MKEEAVNTLGWGAYLTRVASQVVSTVQSLLFDPTLPTMTFDANLQCKTTGWNNNCGLNCLTHFLYSKLEKGELISLYEQDPEYFRLQDTFQEYYGLTERPSWTDIKRILDSMTVPHDREAIFAPVLRQYLGKVIASHAEVFWDTDGVAALGDLLQTDDLVLSDVASPIYQSNNAFFDTLKNNYLANKPVGDFTEAELNLGRERIKTNNEGITQDLSLRKNIDDQEEIKNQAQLGREQKWLDEIIAQGKAEWLQSGCQAYAVHMASLSQGEMISAGQLGILAKNLKINMYVFRGEPKQLEFSENAENFAWIMKVFNSGVHWTYEEPDADAAKMRTHNQCYPDSFYESDLTKPDHEAIFGQFKTNVPEQIQAHRVIWPCLSLPTGQKNTPYIYLVVIEPNVVAHYYDGQRWCESRKTQDEFEDLQDHFTEAVYVDRCIVDPASITATQVFFDINIIRHDVVANIKSYVAGLAAFPQQPVLLPPAPVFLSNNGKASHKKRTLNESDAPDESKQPTKKIKNG